jgi:hypothetical protein
MMNSYNLSRESALETEAQIDDANLSLLLKRQFALIAILIGCVALMACGDADDEEVEEEVGLPSDIANYTSWTSVALGAPPAEATKPTESGGAHGKGTRTVYINPQGVETLKDASKETFPRLYQPTGCRNPQRR